MVGQDFNFSDKIPSNIGRTNIKEQPSEPEGGSGDGALHSDDDSNLGMDRAVLHRLDEQQQSVAYEYRAHTR